MGMKYTVSGVNPTSCRRPPWWVWLLVVIGILIIAALACLLFFSIRDHSTHTRPVLVQDFDPWTPSDNVTRQRSEARQGILLGANCQALYRAGYKTSGVQKISPDGKNNMTVYCEQDMDSGGWTVLQRRFNGQVDFNRRWSEYRDGFGDVAGEHWLGNDHIHLLTAAGNQKLKIEMTHPDGTLAYADYSLFWIESEANNYRLHVSGFVPHTPPGESFGKHNGFEFTTLGRDNDMHPVGNCAQFYHGGWWFHRCHSANLNGLYNGSDWHGIAWAPWTTRNQSLVNTRMMVKTS